VLLAAMNHAKAHNTRLHLMGLVSDGNVHSSEGHYLALLEMAAREGLQGDKVVFHVFTDGRDTPPQSAQKYVARLEEQMQKTGAGVIGSVIGRYWAMDRDHRWERVQKAYDCLTAGKGLQEIDAQTAIAKSYERDPRGDEFIEPTVIDATPRIQENDAVFFFNYRSDRGRELSQAFLNPQFDGFAREVHPLTHYATMTQYSKDLTCPFAFGPRPQRDGLGESVAKAGKTQLRIAETEKYPHVTYFFSGGIETPWPGEERLLVNSPKVATYDMQPEMSAPEVTEKVVSAIRSQKFDCIVLNFAQPDMVGHTGVLEAAIKAVEAGDQGLGEVIEAINEVGGALLVIADHGNCEQMIDYETGKPHTAHTTNPVPCILVGKGLGEVKLRDGGRLADVSPTLLDLMGVAKPPVMTGESLIVR
jgi:2,3-bisphosphoglycerate-independent phosphoglycerate mutase